jgi:hypothetical protein
VHPLRKSSSPSQRLSCFLGAVWQGSPGTRPCAGGRRSNRLNTTKILQGLSFHRMALLYLGRAWREANEPHCSGGKTRVRPNPYRSSQRGLRGIVAATPIVGQRRAQITPDSVALDRRGPLSPLGVPVVLYRDPVHLDARSADGEVDVGPVARPEHLVDGGAGESLETGCAKRGRCLAQFDATRRPSVRSCG